MDARFSSENLFFTAQKLGWKITQSMKSTVASPLWTVLEYYTPKNQYLLLENPKTGVIASCYRDGENIFRLWTNAFTPEPLSPIWSIDQCCILAQLNTESLVSLVQQTKKVPVHPWNKIHLIHQLTGINLDEVDETLLPPLLSSTSTSSSSSSLSSSSSSSASCSSSQGGMIPWPEKVYPLSTLQQFNLDRLHRYLNELYAAELKEIVECCGLPKKKTKVENVTQLLTHILPNATNDWTLLQIDEFVSNLKDTSKSDNPEHHSAYKNNFNPVDLGNKQWYHGGNPRFMVNAWTSHLYFQMCRLLLNNSWVLYEHWKSIPLEEYRISVALGLIQMKGEELDQFD